MSASLVPASPLPFAGWRSPSRTVLTSTALRWCELHRWCTAASVYRT